MSPPGAHFKKEPLGDSFDVQVLKPQGLISLPGAHFFDGNMLNHRDAVLFKKLLLTT